MNGRMAIQASPRKHPDRGARPLKGLEAGIYRPWMAGRIVTGLAKLRNPADQKFGNIAPVGSMAAQTVLFYRGVLPHEGTSFFRMAFVTELIHHICLDHVWAEGAMLIMTVATFDSSFPDRMVGLLIFLGPDGPVAGVAKVWLSGF
jgi:hypothetical protein